MLRVVLVIAILAMVGLCPAVVVAQTPVVSNSLVESVDCCDYEPCPDCPPLQVCPDVTPLAVGTRAVVTVAETSVTLEGLLTSDGGDVCSVKFLYGTSTSYGSSTFWQDGKRSGDSFSEAIEGLLQGTVYHYRAQATNGTVNVEGSDETFVTLPGEVVAPSAIPEVGSIRLGWVKGTGAERTLIKRGTVSAPTTPQEGDLVYLGPEYTLTDTNVEAGVMYQYAIWSEANGVYSATALVVTAVPLVAEPSPGGCGDTWTLVILVGGIAAAIALYILFKQRRPEPSAGLTPTPSDAKGPIGGAAAKETLEVKAQVVQSKTPAVVGLRCSVCGVVEDYHRTVSETAATKTLECMNCGKRTEVSKVGSEGVVVVEVKEEVPAEVAHIEAEKSTESVEAAGGSGFDENAPPCGVCGSRVTQLNEGTQNKYTCMKCGNTFEKVDA